MVDSDQGIAVMNAPFALRMAAVIRWGKMPWGLCQSRATTEAPAMAYKARQLATTIIAYSLPPDAFPTRP